MTLKTTPETGRGKKKKKNRIETSFSKSKLDFPHTEKSQAALACKVNKNSANVTAHHLISVYV